ncbi:MAG: LysM peptidoglycan-binding domain-containing protein [Glaciimonas sp.]|nr:LysM peptidoglycan-binding domain-containing protein [Glaciimonas sp.]
MKKFSTIALKLTAAPIFAALALLAIPSAQAASCTFLSNAPDQHTVMRGDTLWDISGKFLQHPWCWPQVWGLNRDQIRNPHWIYPGQIVYFDRAAGRLRLGSPAGLGGSPNVRLAPGIRTEGLGLDAIPAISASIIDPFLSQPLVIEEDQFNNTPRIVATQEGRVYLGKNDKAYVRGDLQGGTSFQAFRPGKPLKDPETQAVIGFEAVYLGTLKLQRAASTENEAHTFTVVTSKQEIGVGDRLLPVPPTPILNYMPHPPETLIAARIVSIYGGVTHAGQNQVVSINRGKNDGIDIGTVLELSRYGQIIKDPGDKSKTIKLPDEQYGSLFIFRVFNKISYGLIMQVTDSVQVGDVVKSPE